MGNNLSDLIKHYDKPGPRYTAYPMPPVWQDEFPESALLSSLKSISEATTPLSLYAHLPFCKRRCSYCGCNVVISPHYDPVESFIQSLDQEIELWSSHLKGRNQVVQMHWGGGTPNFLSSADLERVFLTISRRFSFLPGSEISIELDPTFLTSDQLPRLKDLGFNRVSFGVQDTDDQVQELITRGQTWEQTETALSQSRALGFEGINVDLVYGLPGQTYQTFKKTLERVVGLQPSRLAVYGFAYIPDLLPFQKSIDPNQLPAANLKLDLLLLANEYLENAGYVSLGMDHFAHPDDSLARAFRQGKLSRNFMGYAIAVGGDMVSFGPSAISNINNVYHQNHKNLSKWSQAVSSGHFAMSKGLVCNLDDQIRRWVIHQLMSRFLLQWNEVSVRWGINGKEYFADALVKLEMDAALGMVIIDDEGIEVTSIGKRFIRNLVMPFDAYLDNLKSQPFSRTI